MTDAARPPSLLPWAAGLALVALALLGLGLAVDASRALLAWLAVWAAAVSTALGALTLILIADVTGARWFEPFRPAAALVAGGLPLLALLFLPVALGLDALYPWAGEIDQLPRHLQHQIAQTRGYLNVPFFLGRSVLYLAFWSGLAVWAGRRAPDRRGAGASAVALIVVALTVHFAAVDWLMSLQPEWYSTVFGLYFWAGGFVAALGAIAVLGLTGPAPEAGASEGDRAALGKMLVTFVVWWAYLAFSQYLIIWMADLPPEISWYLPRTAGFWGALAVLLVLGHLLLPLLALLAYASKRARRVLSAVGAWLLGMHVLDVYWMTVPAHAAGPHWLDAAALAAVVALGAAYGAWRLKRRRRRLSSICGAT